MYKNLLMLTYNYFGKNIELIPVIAILGLHASGVKQPLSSGRTQAITVIKLTAEICLLSGRQGRGYTLYVCE